MPRTINLPREKKKKSQSRIVYPDKLSFKGEDKIKMFSHMKRLTESISTDGPPHP